MSRDAKIGTVVVLVIVGLLIIIWGRSGDRPEDTALAPDNKKVDTARTGTGGTTPSPGTTHLTLPIPPGVTMPTTGTTGTTGTTPTTGISGTTPPPPAPKEWEYTVAQGDRGLQQIAKDKLGDLRRWKEIAQLNNMKAPYALRIGQKLKMPSKDATPAAATTAGTTPVPSGPVLGVGPVGPVAGTTDIGLVVAGTTGTTPVGPVAGFGPVAGTTDIGPVVAGTTGTTPTAGTAAAAAVATRKYKVPGDVLSLSQIAREQLGDGKKWKTIASLNNLAAPYTIRAGQTLLLPQ